VDASALLDEHFHSMEPHVFAWIGKYVRAGSVALDIGANFGMMSLYMGRITGPTGRVFAFEPSPANGAVLRFHCEHNPRLNIQPVDVAVSNQDNSSVSFFLMEGVCTPVIPSLLTGIMSKSRSGASRCAEGDSG